jgi:hypothetical protein
MMVIVIMMMVMIISTAKGGRFDVGINGSWKRESRGCWE